MQVCDAAYTSVVIVWGAIDWLRGVVAAALCAPQSACTQEVLLRLPIFIQSHWICLESLSCVKV